MFAVGPDPVYSVNVPRSRDTLLFLSPHFPPQMLILTSSTLILLDCYHHPYLLTCVDHFTRWPEAIPLTAITAEAVAYLGLPQWVDLTCWGSLDHHHRPWTAV